MFPVLKRHYVRSPFGHSTGSHLGIETMYICFSGLESCGSPLSKLTYSVIRYGTTLVNTTSLASELDSRTHIATELSRNGAIPGGCLVRIVCGSSLTSCQCSPPGLPDRRAPPGLVPRPAQARLFVRPVRSNCILQLAPFLRLSAKAK
jgi:hypothetical protein